MANRKHRAVIAAATVLAFVALAGCAETDVEATAAPWIDESFEDKIAATIAAAREAGASAAQLALLEESQEAGEVTYETSRIGALNVIDCFEAAGLSAQFKEHPSTGGWLIPGYGVAHGPGMSDEAAEVAIDRCDQQEFFYLSALYQTQPAALEVGGAHIMASEDVLRECFTRLGHPPDPDANGWEIAHWALPNIGDFELVLICFDEADIHGF